MGTLINVPQAGGGLKLGERRMGLKGAGEFVATVASVKVLSR